MKLTLRDGLLFLTVRILFHGQGIEISDVLVDTGSGSTILKADQVAQVGIVPEPGDLLHTIHGVGGSEVVFARQADQLAVGDSEIAGFEIEVGAVDYGLEMNGILGLDFLLRSGAVLDLGRLNIEFPPLP